MRAILMFVLLAASFAASAVPVPGTNPSGVYIGEDRACHIAWQRQGDHILTTVTCLYWNGNLSASASMLYAPGGACRSDAPIAFDGQLRNEYVSLRWFNPGEGSLQIVRGADINAVANGVAISETWHRIASTQTNYTCAANGRRR